MVTKKVTYNSWPSGKLPEELQRQELIQLKDFGYIFSDPRDVITMFEERVAVFAGSKYAVSVDCCTHAMELSLRYLLHKGEIKKGDIITIPLHTYVSVAMMLYQLGFWVEYEDKEWSGMYRLGETRVTDCAVRWKSGMYLGYNDMQCVSFQIKKRIPIGRGGVILTDDKEAADWIRLSSYDGRDLTLPYDHPDHVKVIGYHYYMTPEDAARGLLLMDAIKEEGDTMNNTMYPNVKDMLNFYNKSQK